MSNSLGRRVLAGAVRTANLVIAGVGATMIGYGGYLATKFSGAPNVWGALIALGCLDALFASALLCCAYRSLFVLRLYGLVLGGLTIAEAAIAVLFWVPSTRDRVINAADLPADLRDDLQTNMTVAGIVLAAVVGFQAFTLALVGCQCAAVDPLNNTLLDDDAGAADSTALLGGGRDKGGRDKGGRDKGGASAARLSSIERADRSEAAVAAAGRYKSGKAGEMYEKYGVR